MSHSHRSFHNYNGVIDSLNREAKKLEAHITPENVDEFLTVKYDGFKFNVLPFLLNSIHYILDNYEPSRHRLWNLVLKESDCQPVSSTSKDLKYIDVTLMSTLLPSYFASDGLVETCMWLADKNLVSLTRLLYAASNRVFSNFIANQNTTKYSFKCKGICNTEAMGYYLAPLWVMQKSRFIPIYLGKEIKQAHIIDNIKDVFPSECCQYKYLSGQITSEEMLKEYKENLIAIKEFVSLATEGEYDGRELNDTEKKLASDALNILNSNNFEGQLYRYISYVVFYNEDTTLLQDKYKALEEKHERISKENDRLVTNLSKTKVKYETERAENIELKNLVDELRTQLNTIQTDEELKQEIEELKKKVKELETDHDECFKDYIECKRELSKQTKDNKKLKAKLSQFDTEIEEIIEEEITDISIDEMCEFLKDKHIIIEGGLNIKAYEDRFKEKGLDKVSMVRNHNKVEGTYDLAVVLITTTKHCHVRTLEKCLNNTKIIYYAGVNADNLIVEMYKELKED